MGASTMNITTIGLDLAKNVFQVHAIDARGKVALRKQLKRNEMGRFFANLPPCVIGMEACASSHHWGRTLERERVIAFKCAAEQDILSMQGTDQRAESGGMN